MVFNLQRFLVENKLTKRSKLNEENITGAEMKTDAEQEEMNDEEMFGDDEEDSWYKGDSGDAGEFEKEPTVSDAEKDAPALRGIGKKQAELKNLENKKDTLLMQLKSGQLSLDQYKAAIGNIPTQIKDLRFDIEQAMNRMIGGGDEEEEI